MIVVEGLPLGQPLREIDVVGVAEELVELLLIRPVRPLDLAVELRRPRLDVDVPDALIAQVPVNSAWNSCPRSVRMVWIRKGISG